MKKLVINKNVAKRIMNPLLKLDNFLYKIISALAVELGNGVHPKHKILQHKEWFRDHIKKGEVVLDVGSNTGSMAVVMSQQASFVYGIEIDEKLHNKALARDAGPSISYICADATTYNYNSLQPVDVVTLSNVLEHIEDRMVFLKKLIETIVWSGSPKFLIRVPMRDREWVTLYKQERGVESRLDLTHFTEYTEQEFRGEMLEAGLEIEFVEIKFGELYALCHKK